jgi:CheY-like chemotaxis protein/HPt (histidine-containing phosphotransfer) domain-containing protein
LTKPFGAFELLDAVRSAREPKLRGVDAAGPAAAAVGRRAARVLLAEDNLVNQKLAVRVLEKEGHTVTVVGDGEAAVVAALSDDYDVILMDVQMPKLNGFEATAAIRARQAAAGRPTPIVAMTAHAMKGDRRRCLEAGMDEYIAKPIQATELLQMIDTLTAGRAATTEPQASADTPAPPTDSGPVLDAAEALERCGQDRELLAELVELFYEDLPKLLGEIDQAITAGDAAGLTRAAHTLKGAVSNFSAHPTAGVARGLEFAGRDGQLDRAPGLRAQLTAELARLEPVLKPLGTA